jgi:hypothetical protein
LVAEHRVVVEQRAVAVAEEHVAAVVGVINQSFVMFLVDCKTWKWREAICGERS